MALLGEIKVNETVIGRWAAVRQEYLRGTEDEYEYSTVVTMNGEPEHFAMITHKYSDGAVVLARKVLETYAGR